MNCADIGGARVRFPVGNAIVSPVAFGTSGELPVLAQLILIILLMSQGELGDSVVPLKV